VALVVPAVNQMRQRAILLMVAVNMIILPVEVAHMVMEKIAVVQLLALAPLVIVLVHLKIILAHVVQRIILVHLPRNPILVHLPVRVILVLAEQKIILVHVEQSLVLVIKIVVIKPVRVDLSPVHVLVVLINL
jgi:hypothetical protein